MKVHHLTYATRDYAYAARLLARSARRFGLAETTICGPADPLVRGLAARHPEVMAARRGAGFWLWKPFIVAEALAKAADGDAVLYTDAAVRIVSDPSPLLDLAREHPVVLFEMVPHLLQKHWTKRDLFVMLDADRPEYWDAPQLSAGYQLYRASAAARDFAAELCAAAVKPGALTDEANRLGLPNLPGFCEHRHDQSVLTMIARRHRVPVFPDPSQWGPRRPRAAIPAAGEDIVRPAAPYGQIFHVHRLRDAGLLRRTGRWLAGDYGPWRALPAGR